MPYQLSIETGYICGRFSGSVTTTEFRAAFEYLASKAIEEKLSRTFSAVRIKDWAKSLSPEQRAE